MKLTILGSGGCIPIPKPLCQCPICKEARGKGIPYSRTGPAAFLNDLNMLIDTPPQVCGSLNNADIKKIDRLLYTHLDSDHLDGHFALISFYFDGTKYCYSPKKTIALIVPDKIGKKLKKISGQYGSIFDYYERIGALNIKVIKDKIKIKGVTIIPIPVRGNPASSYIFLFDGGKGRKILYAPCDTKPFPFGSDYVYNADVFITQPGYFETGLKGNFVYPRDDYTRKELYSFDETLEITKRIKAGRIVFTHLEEYWNRNYDDYKSIEKCYDNVEFAYDGMVVKT